jgi:hypothetical protein
MKVRKPKVSKTDKPNLTAPGPAMPDINPFPRLTEAELKTPLTRVWPTD